MKEKKLVVFDMDGTLNRIELFIIPTYKEVLQKFAGAQADDDTVMRLMGCVTSRIYQGLLPGAPMERFDEFMALTAEAEYRNIDRYHGAFDGVPQMIVSCRKRDIFLPCAPTAPMVMCVKLRPRWGWRPILPGCRERNRAAPNRIP